MFLFWALASSLLPFEHLPTFATSWTDGNGDWHDISNWDAGIPDSTTDALINQGNAQFAAPVAVRELVIGSASTHTTNATGVVTGADDLRFPLPFMWGNHPVQDSA